jgi:hypothetical protein
MKLKEELRLSFPEWSDKKIEKSIHGFEWILPEHKVHDRQVIVEKIISLWKEKGIVNKEFEQPITKLLIYNITRLKPITLDMIVDFLMGWATLQKNQKQKSSLLEAKRLIKPILDKLIEYYTSIQVKNSLIDKHISKKDSIIIDGWDNINTRTALKEFVKDKFVILNKEIIDRQKFEYREHKKEIYKKIQQELSGKMLIGFACNLSPETVKEVFIFMAGKNNLNGELSDFQSIFSKVSISVEKPIKWLIKNKRGIKSDRGNQTALFEFLKLMLGTVSNNDLKKCKNLFIDEKGYFIQKDLLRPDKEKIKLFGFETQLKDILKKADQPKN